MFSFKFAAYLRNTFAQEHLWKAACGKWSFLAKYYERVSVEIWADEMINSFMMEVPII